MDNDTIKIEVNYCLEDIQNYQRYHMFHRMSPMQLAILGSLFIGFVVISDIHQFRSGGFLSITITLLILMIAVIIAYRLAPKIAAKRLVESNKLLRNTQCFQINSEGIKVNSPTSESNIPWDILYKTVETKDNFLFYLSEMQAFIIPKRFLTGTEEQIALIREYMKKVRVTNTNKSECFSPSFLVYIAVFIVVLFFAYINNK